jgi:hypothetical protein
MRWRAKPEMKTLTEELAAAISRYDIARVAELLTDNGSFSVQNERFEVLVSNKEGFISWLNECYKKIPADRKSRTRLQYTIVKSMHSILDSSIILLEDGRFPLFSENQEPAVKSGMVIKLESGKVCGIKLCVLVMKTESPFIYERKILG